MKKAFFVIPGMLIVTAAVCAALSMLFGEGITDAALWFADWVPASLVSASVYVLALRCGKNGGIRGLRYHVKQLVRIGIAAVVLALGIRSVAVPLFLRTVENRVPENLLAAAEMGIPEDDKDITDDTPLPEAAPVENNAPDVVQSDRAESVAALAASDFTVDNLISAAAAARREDRWFDAHYYAVNALAQIDETDPRRREVDAVASDAWRRLSNADVYIDNKARAFFLRKRSGYTDLINGRVLNAYAAFADLRITNPNDSDVARYYRIASDEVKARYFFTDELNAFDRIKTGGGAVYFTLKTNTGGTTLITAESLIRTGDNTALARRFTRTVFGANGRVIIGSTAPWAKLVSVPARSLRSDLRRRFNITGDADILLVMIDGVLRENGTIVTSPDYVLAEGETRPAENTLYVDASLEDVFRIRDAASGSSRMALPELLSFLFNAERFGYPAAEYLLALVDFAALPFLLIVLIALGFASAVKAGFGEKPPPPLLAALFLLSGTALAYGALKAFSMLNTLLALTLIVPRVSVVNLALMLLYHLVLLWIGLSALFRQ